MTNLIDRAVVVSVADRNLTTEGEARTMSVTTAYTRRYPPVPSRRARPHGVDRLVMRLSLAMLLWARRRADRAQPGHEEHAIRRAVALSIERERHAAMARIYRVF